MKIASDFLRGIISKIAMVAIRKKLGCEVKVQVNGVEAKVVGGKTRVHLDLDAEMEKEELLRLLKKVGL